MPKAKSSGSEPDNTKVKLIDPRERFAKPPFPKQQQRPPGNSRELKPPADYGETTYTGHGRLEGRAALITGADSGIGRAVALCYAKEGADILFTHLKEEAADAEETVRLVESVGRRAIAIPGDIRKRDFCRKLVDQTFARLGRLDILVNNAAYQRTYDKLEDIPEEEFDAAFRTNVYGTFFMTQAAFASHATRRIDHQHLLHRNLHARALTRSLCSHKSRARQLDQELRQTRHGARSARERRRSRSGVDAADSVHHGARSRPRLRPEHDLQTARNARRAGRDLRLPASDDASYVNGEIYGATGGRMPI